MAKHWMDIGGIQNTKRSLLSRSSVSRTTYHQTIPDKAQLLFFFWYQTGGESSRENTFYKKATSLLTIYSNMYQSFKQVILNLE